MRLCALVAFAVSALLTCTLVAQEKVEPSRGPDGGTRYRVQGIQVLPATGRPFSARDHIEWTRNLADGTVVDTELYAYVARDSQGRIYREHRNFIPAHSNQESRQRDLVLLDPVTHKRTTCIIAARRCTVTAYHASATFVLNPDGVLDEGKRFLTRGNLGRNVIDGIDVTGTRETLQIGSGVVGNDQTLVRTRDFWYSPALQVNLSVTRKDPEVGTQVLQLVDLSLAEPDPKIFQLPPGFTVQELRSKVAKSAN